MDSYRLPRTVIPSRYDLRLEPDLNTSTFRGEETIHLAVHEPVSEILLNAIELQIDSAIVNAASSPQASSPMPRACGISLDQTTERCRLTVATPLASGQWQLHV